jgi:hypothetical protein
MSGFRIGQTVNGFLTPSERWLISSQIVSASLTVRRLPFVNDMAMVKTIMTRGKSVVLIRKARHYSSPTSSKRKVAIEFLGEQNQIVLII